MVKDLAKASTDTLSNLGMETIRSLSTNLIFVNMPLSHPF